MKISIFFLPWWFDFRAHTGQTRHIGNQRKELILFFYRRSHQCSVATTFSNERKFILQTWLEKSSSSIIACNFSTILFFYTQIHTLRNDEQLEIFVSSEMYPNFFHSRSSRIHLWIFFILLSILYFFSSCL